MDVSNIGKITRVVCKPSWAFVVRHVVVTDDYFNSKDQSGIIRTSRSNPFYIYDYTEKQTNESLKGVMFRTDESSIMLLNDLKEAKNNDLKSTEKPEPRGYAFIRPKNFYHVHKGLDKALAWLTEDEFVNLFSSDDKGKVAKVTNEELYHLSSLGYNRHLLFKPAVVYDKDGNSYQGIELRSDVGHLASMSCEEYTSFYYYMKELMNNFSAMSLQLFTTVLESLKNGGRGGS